MTDERDGHFYYRNIPLPAIQPVVVTEGERHSLLCCRGWELGQHGGKNSNAIDTSSYFSHRTIKSMSHLTVCLLIICTADINLLHRPCSAPLVTPLQREVNMWDAMDDPLWRSNVWLRNPFSIQRGEWKRKRTATEKRWVEHRKRVPMKECWVNEGKDQNGNMS